MMESLFKATRSLTRIAASLQYALPLSRKYFFLDALPFYLNRPVTKYIKAEIGTVSLQTPKQREFIDVYVDDEIRIPDYPYTFILETWSRESLLLGWLILRTEYIPDGIRLHDKAWVPNTQYDLPELNLLDIEVVIETPDHFFDRPGQLKHSEAFRYTSMN
jgi:hypothetical protein